jgi:hypothetical protein
MSELSTLDTAESRSEGTAGGNINYRHAVDTQGNITGPREEEEEEEEGTDSEMTTSEDTTTGTALHCTTTTGQF